MSKYLQPLDDKLDRLPYVLLFFRLVAQFDNNDKMSDR